MTDNQQTEILNWDEKKNKLPETLNVVSILSLIGCGLGFILSIWGYIGAPKNYEKLQEMQGKLDEMPAYVKKLAGPEALEMSRKSLENRMPILLLSLVGCSICLYGVLQMRARKKVGFSIYTIGELLPLVVSIIFLGMASFGGFAIAFGLIIPLVFIILYATQLKHMK